MKAATEERLAALIFGVFPPLTGKAANSSCIQRGTIEEAAEAGLYWPRAQGCPVVMPRNGWTIG
jgi:hypothetical protein